MSSAIKHDIEWMCKHLDQAIDELFRTPDPEWDRWLWEGLLRDADRQIDLKRRSIKSLALSRRDAAYQISQGQPIMDLQNGTKLDWRDLLVDINEQIALKRKALSKLRGTRATVAANLKRHKPFPGSLMKALLGVQ